MAFTTEPCAMTTAAIRPSTMSEKYSGAPKVSAMRRAAADGGDQQRRDRPREERAERGDGERLARPPLPRHLVAVERGDDRPRLARKVDEDRGGRAAILRAVIDAGEHDHRADRRQVEGDRQQDGDRGGGAEAGQHPDQRAEQGSGEAIGEVPRRQRHLEPKRQVVENLYQGNTFTVRPRPQLKTATAKAVSARRKARPGSA